MARPQGAACGLGAYERAGPPSIGALSPAEVTAGGGPLTLTVTGAGFAPGARVLWNGEARATTYVSATELRAQILAEDVATPGAATIGVANPGDGGATTAGATLTVAPAEAPPEPVYLPLVRR